MRPKIKTRKRILKTEVKKYRLKVHSSSKKRFKISNGGKGDLIIGTQANKRHNMRKRSARQIRNQRGTTVLTDNKIIFKFRNLHLH